MVSLSMRSAAGTELMEARVPTGGPAGRASRLAGDSRTRHADTATDYPMDCAVRTSWMLA